MSIVTYEDKFYEILKDMYIGTPIKGDSGYVNLMTMKAKHFEIIEEELTKVVNEKTKKFPEFKEELYERLYDFFKDYFTDTGSIYYTYNELNKNTYEKVYSENEDVSLFWKTQMLYYVKTDILYQDIEFEVDDIVYYFDVSKLDHKRNNEKREIIYRECKVEENKDTKKIIFYPEYSVRGRTTKTNDILKKINNKGINIIEEELLKIFRIFEKQSEVDYFINKNSKKFLRDRFDVYLYQYMFGDGERSYNKFNEKRINQLMVLKDVAYDVIDFISQFEDELVRIWNKPKFVLDSNYIITKDKIMEQNNGDKILNKLIASDGIDGQISEWKELGIVDDGFKLTNILDEKYKYLPFDTKYFKEHEKLILSLFEDVSKELDGEFIYSDNYQALNTLKEKYRGKVECIYIDPPFNLESNADFSYKVNYKDSNWATMLENRINLAKDFLSDTGMIFVRCDNNGNHIVRMILDKVFGEDNFRNEIIINRFQKSSDGLTNTTESLFFYTKRREVKINPIQKQRQCIFCNNILEPQWQWSHSAGASNIPRYFEVNGEKVLLYPPRGRHWTNSQEKIDEMQKEGRIRIDFNTSYIDCNNEKIGYIPEILQDENVNIDNNWTDIPGYEFGVFTKEKFSTQNSEILLKRVIEIASQENEIIFDFFAGSGTTQAVAQKLGRRWIGVEMGEHFYTTILPRMKRVLAYDSTGISKNDDVKEIYAKDKAGGFFKYYKLEQYEDTLRKAIYKDDEHLIYNQNKSPFEQYVFLRDEKLNYCMEIQGDEVKVDLSKLYEKIDIPETLSNLTGKWIKKITEDEVIFEDGTKVDLNNIDYKMIKPLIWWCE